MFLDNVINGLHKGLYSHPVALDYLHNRGLSDEDIETYKLGYSTVLAVASDGSEEYKKFMEETSRGQAFVKKITFPIWDQLGQAVGLLGRGIETKEFKFFLTAEAKFSGAFFGLYHALKSIYELNRVFVVEGPFDFFALKKVLPNTVASLTAELTQSQYNILKLYTDNIVTVFDSDGPGRAATARAKARDPKIRDITINFKDPDKALKELGFKKFEELVKREVGKSLWM